MDGVRGTANVEQLRLDAVQRETYRPQGHGLIAQGRRLDGVDKLAGIGMSAPPIPRGGLPRPRAGKSGRAGGLRRDHPAVRSPATYGAWGAGSRRTSSGWARYVTSCGGR